MKIKLETKSYEDVLKIPPYANKRPYVQKPFWRWLMKTLSARELKDCDFSFETEGMERLKKDEPCLIFMNHSSFTDLQIATTLLSDRQFHIVMTLDGFVGKEDLMYRIGCIPARKFIPDTPLIKDLLYCFRKLKSSVLMFPEASYSFDGTATAFPKSVAKSLKLFQVPVVMVTTHGSFHRDPLYNGLQKRKVSVHAKVEVLLSPEEIREKSVKELHEILQKTFSFDHWRWQREHNIRVTEPFRADGLERVLYRCPVCGKETGMKGKGITLTCDACKTTWELAENGALICKDHDAPLPQGFDFSYVSDWYRWERSCVKNEVTSGTYRLDTPVEILAVRDTKSAYRIGTGRLIHDASGFHLTGCHGALSYTQPAKQSYSLYADYFWYELGDMISIGNMEIQYYCIPQDPAVNVAKVRLAQEEMYAST